MEERMLLVKIILSRKGFDSSFGGHPSPILPDGRLLSIPIPSENDGISYGQIRVDTQTSYYDIMVKLYQEIKENEKSIKLRSDTKCHLDPDLIGSAYARKPGWRPVFGQMKAAQSHLSNQKIDIGDIFLFFGLFRKAVYDENGSLVFDKNPLHVIFGYLQIGAIHRVDKDYTVPDWMRYHAHTGSDYKGKNKNTIYESSEILSFNHELPGAGVFNFDKSLALTKDGGHRVSEWELPSFFRNIDISYHPKKSKYGWNDSCFRSASIGQEFVIEENDNVTLWAKSLIERNSCKKKIDS